MKSEDVVEVVRQLALHERSEQPTSEEAVETDPSRGLDEHQKEWERKNRDRDLAERKDTHDLRIKYVGRIFWLVTAWLVCVVLCVLLAGLHDVEITGKDWVWIAGFALSDAVLIAFITSTTLNVLGLFLLVAKWMYPSGGTNGRSD